MKKITSFSLALTFAGCFLGAGFVSGQEIWQFFGCFGWSGLVGIIIAIGGLSLFGVILLRLSQITGITEMDRIIIQMEIPWLRTAVAILQCVSLFGIVAIMIAGAGSLIHQLTGFPGWISSLLMTIGVAILTMQGIRGMISAFSICVPIIVLSTFVFSIVTIIHSDIPPIHLVPVGSRNPLLPNWIIAAITFTAYNFFSTIGILTPLGKLLPRKKTIYIGIILGGLFLYIIAGSILVALITDGSAYQFELPMLMTASRISLFAGSIYGILLFLSMFGTTVSCLVAITSFFEQKYIAAKQYPSVVVWVVCAISFAASLVGFGDLIGTVYPILGYLSIGMLICLVVGFLKTKQNKRHSAG